MEKNTTITIHPDTLDALLMGKSALEHIISHKLTWDEALGQMILLAEIYHKEPITAHRATRHGYDVLCPECGLKHELNGRRAIIWRVKCGCGKEFITA